jgi:hypothetical protein
MPHWNPRLPRIALPFNKANLGDLLVRLAAISDGHRVPRSTSGCM